MPGMPALSGGEIGTGSMSGRANPLAWQQSGAEEVQPCENPCRIDGVEAPVLRGIEFR